MDYKSIQQGAHTIIVSIRQNYSTEHNEYQKLFCLHSVYIIKISWPKFQLDIMCTAGNKSGTIVSICHAYRSLKMYSKILHSE